MMVVITEDSFESNIQKFRNTLLQCIHVALPPEITSGRSVDVTNAYVSGSLIYIAKISSLGMTKQ